MAVPIDLNAYRLAVHLDEPPAEVGALDPSAYASALDRVLAFLATETRRDVSGISQDEKMRAVRFLLTIRAPKAIPAAIMTDLDQCLKTRDLHRTVVDAQSLATIRDTYGGLDYPAADHCVIWRGDITQLSIGAIVNAANSQMLGCFDPSHLCIDNVIHWAAGPRVRQDCATIMDLQDQLEPTGNAKITRGYHLPADYILHTVGPIVRGALSEDQRQDLASAYRSCLDLAAQVEGLNSIAFCGVSTGIFGFPKAAAAEIALSTVAQWLADNPNKIDRVVFNVFSQEDAEIYAKTLEEY